MLAAMAASYPDAVVVSGVDGCVRYVNPAAERLFGGTAADLQGKHVSRLSSPDEQLRSRGMAARIVAGEHVATPSVMEMQREDGSTFFAEVTLSTTLGERVVDARPSDAVALASRVDAPIWVADAVMADAGVLDTVTEAETDEDDEDVPDEVARERLDEFKRFLDDVDPEDFAAD